MPNTLERTLVYKQWMVKLHDIPDDPGLLPTFELLRSTIAEQSKWILRIFPEYTPHDATRHLENLFVLADRLLGMDVYGELNAAELSLFCFGLYSHDWGMAVGDDERDAILGLQPARAMPLLAGEIERFRKCHSEGQRIGKTDDLVWEDYLRDTHAARSACRLRSTLRPLGNIFAEMVARVAEGHVLDIRELRDADSYPQHVALFGQDANVAGITALVRLVDLFDLAEDRTPFALWSIINPRNEISRMEWKKHRALAPVVVKEGPGVRQVLITGVAEDPELYGALADLQSWVNSQFAETVDFLRDIGGRYDLGLDTAVRWDISAIGFKPVRMRFEFDRPAALGLLSKEIYGGKDLTFVRELLQNSVDAIDARVALLRNTDTPLCGRISVELASSPDSVSIKWNDNGIGMDLYVLQNYFARVGRSWYQSTDFQKHSLGDPISKFGIGLLSCFAVSQSVTIVTKREPLVSKDSRTWQVNIPSLDAFFRVTETHGGHVGTTVFLKIDLSGPHRKAAAVADEIKRVGALIGYDIALKVDGESETVKPATGMEDARLPFLQVSSLDESALNSMKDLVREFSYRYSSPAGEYELFYSCLLPRDLRSLKYVESGKWHFEGETVDFNRLIVEGPTPLFMKGVACSTHAHYPGVYGVSSIAINVLRPSLVRPDLSRGHIDTKDLDLSRGFEAVALRIRDLLGANSASIDERARALSAGILLTGLPQEALSHIISAADWPVLCLEADRGLSWRKASAIFGCDELLQAPDELSYILSLRDKSKHAQDAELSSLGYWGGPWCFVPLEEHPSGPMWSRAGLLARTYLGEEGFGPVGLHFVSSAEGDDVPLVCCVWRKASEDESRFQRLDLASLCAEWRRSPMLRYPGILRRALRTGHGTVNEAPLLLPFPPEMDNIFAIGSLYWNQNNLKVQSMVEILLELSIRFEQRGLSGRGQRRFQHVNDTSYLGYVVPARHSGVRAAIGRYKALLEIARDEGVPCPEPLETNDFFPGSVGEYWNPYHYPISLWGHSKEPIGTPWAPKPSGAPPATTS